MKQTFIVLLLLCLGVCTPGIAGSIDPASGCKVNPAVVDACFSVRGRVSAYNGTPALRIWPVGTNRLLGIVPAENEIMPENIKGKVSFQKSVFATLEVCPFTPAHPRVMQLVCIESATNVEVRPRQ